MGTFPVHHADGCPPCPALSRPSRVLTHPMLSSSQVLERLRSRRRLQGGDPGGVAGGPGGCSQLAGCTSPCQSQQSRESRACRDRGSGEAGQALGRERSQAGPSPSPLTCHRAQPRLRASAAMNHRTLQGRGCLRCSFLLGNRFSSILSAWGSPALPAKRSQAHSLPLILTQWGEKREPRPHTHGHVVPHGPSARASLSLQNTRAFSKSPLECGHPSPGPLSDCPDWHPGKWRWLW